MIFHSALAYVNANQVPPFLMRRSRMIERLGLRGTPVGLFAAVLYEEESVQLQHGDLLFCCSDGLTEVPNSDGEMWDDSTVEGIRQSQIGLSPAAVISNVAEAADRYAADEDQADGHDTGGATVLTRVTRYDRLSPAPLD
ncbi:MAG: serine/threonine-protein phosphatase [Bryobacter sp.]|nr:serine/threonine-protein phosphatase [Bryobacter sp. CoA8 C33]